MKKNFYKFDHWLKKHSGPGNEFKAQVLKELKIEDLKI